MLFIYLFIFFIYLFIFGGGGGRRALYSSTNSYWELPTFWAVWFLFQKLLSQRYHPPLQWPLQHLGSRIAVLRTSLTSLLKLNRPWTLLVESTTVTQAGRKSGCSLDWLHGWCALFWVGNWSQKLNNIVKYVPYTFVAWPRYGGVLVPTVEKREINSVLLCKSYVGGNMSYVGDAKSWATYRWLSDLGHFQLSQVTI